MGLEENEKAIAAYEAAIRLLPPKSAYFTQCYFNMSNCYKKMGKVEQANACLEKMRSRNRASDVR
jgi:tetratricopeptide (TPR) repeat protein